MMGFPLFHYSNIPSWTRSPYFVQIYNLKSIALFFKKIFHTKDEVYNFV